MRPRHSRDGSDDEISSLTHDKWRQKVEEAHLAQLLYLIFLAWGVLCYYRGTKSLKKTVE